MYLRYIPNDTLKWLKKSRLYGSIDGIFDVSLSKLQPRKEAQMGKSLNGKELEKGISQRKDGLYQARFVNRFGKRETIYAKTLNEIRHQLRTEQYEDEKMLNVISKGLRKPLMRICSSRMWRSKSIPRSAKRTKRNVGYLLSEKRSFF